MVEIENGNDGWPKITENQTNHVVATGINREVTVMQYLTCRTGAIAGPSTIHERTQSASTSTEREA